MTPSRNEFLNDVKRFILEPDLTPPWSVAEAKKYCRKFAFSHEENFVVASLLLPRRYRSAMTILYTYCRWADDLGDEIFDDDFPFFAQNSAPNSSQNSTLDSSQTSASNSALDSSGSLSLQLFDFWEAELRQTFLDFSPSASTASLPQSQKRQFCSHPVFVALGDLLQKWSLPEQPFHDLLTAFRRDQSPQTIKTLADLEEYCRYSAHPVGRLILALALRQPSDRQLAESDAICSALQWTNFWQDVQRDAALGRCYVPQDFLQTEPFDQVILKLVARTRQKFEEGRPLTQSGRLNEPKLPFFLRFEIAFILECGLGILKKIEKINGQTDRERPTLSKWEKVKIAVRTMIGLIRCRG